MTVNFFSRALAVAATFWAASGASALVTLTPLTTFGGDGWLAPGEGGYAYLGTGGTERGMDFDPVTGNLLLASRVNVAGNANNVRVINGTTGADTGGLPVGTGVISGGTFTINQVQVAADGAVYVSNLASPLGATTPLNVYRWSSDALMANDPELVLSTTSLTTGRLGDDLALFGSGANVKLALGEGTAGTGSRNSFVIATPTGVGNQLSATLVAISTTPAPAAGNFRLGLAFVDGDTVVGTQGGAGEVSRVVDFLGAAGAVASSFAFADVNERAMDFIKVGAVSLLATVQSNTSTVRVYDVSAGLTGQLVPAATGTTTFGALTANGNGVGQVSWGAVSGNSVTLYAMNTNQGIQAFTVMITVPEPGVAGLCAVCGFIGVRRRRR
jgi:hypothetical protein